MGSGRGASVAPKERRVPHYGTSMRGWKGCVCPKGDVAAEHASCMKWDRMGASAVLHLLMLLVFLLLPNRLK